jgi:hypothetical protein
MLKQNEVELEDSNHLFIQLEVELKILIVNLLPIDLYSLGLIWQITGRGHQNLMRFSSSNKT